MATATSTQINQYNVHNAGLWWHVNRYPKTGITRYWLDQFKYYQEAEGKEPTSIKIHEVCQVYGGPEEGGWWYQAGQVEGTHCIFSKKQCIQRCIELTYTYKLWLQPTITTSHGFSAIDLTLGSGYATDYPETRPRYE
jgi:hypothetical protein